MKITFLVTIFICSLSLQGAEFQMLEISSDMPGEKNIIYRMKVEVKEDMEIVAFHKDKLNAEGNIERRRSYALSDINDGYVMEHQQGRDVIILRSRNFDSYVGGELKLSYLFNGLKGKWRHKYLNLRFMGGKWHLQTSRYDLINKMRIEVRKWVGKIVGIKDLHFSM